MWARVQCKNATERVTPSLALACALSLCASGCVDNGNDVGFRLGLGGGGSGGITGGSGASATTLPPLPRLPGVGADVTGDSVSITLEPLAGAVDYRVYALPKNQDISLSQDGQVSIKNALYRCAGNRQAPPVALDGAEPLPSGYMKTLVDGQAINGFTRSLDDATLGHVYLESGKGRVPVYALGDAEPLAENEAYFMRWQESRVKHYVTAASERDALLARGFRDDGIAFYVPAAAASNTRWVYASTDAQARYYFIDGPEAALRENPSQAFLALTRAEPGSSPLMRVYYLNYSGTSHDELLAGLPRFERARQQGSSLPLYALHWSGLTEPTTLVVEALNPGCPSLPGLLAPISLAANETHPAWLTMAEARAASAEGALYVNGQFAEDSRPRAIARAFLNDVAPEPAPPLDWSWGFRADEALGTFATEPCGDPSGTCFQDFRQRSERFDTSFMYVETDRQVLAPFLGELWVMYADLQSGVNGKFRMTALEKAEVSPGAFLHVTMDVNAFTTGRRYPQLIISDQDVPVQHQLPNGNSVVIQSYGDWPSTFELQVCDHRPWDVNNQCPFADLDHYFDPADPTKKLSLAPNAEVGEHVGMDRSTRFEAYVSTTRAYLLLDGEPYGCVDLPATGTPAGPVTVTFGDTLFHSGNDQLQFYGYPRERLYHDTQRHFDNLGFKNNVPAPAWDESRLPCVSGFFTH